MKHTNSYSYKRIRNNSFQDILYVTTNILTVTMGLIKICIIMTHKEEFINLIVYVQQHFWNVKYDFREKEILNNCKKTCTFFVCSVTIMGACAIVAYLTTPVIGRFYCSIILLSYSLIVCCRSLIQVGNALRGCT